MDGKTFTLLIVLLFESFGCIPFARGSLEIKHTIRVASDLSPRLLDKLTEYGRHNRYKGFIKDFCDELMNILGYKYEIVLPHSGQHGANTSSAYGHGIFEMLLRNEADLAFGGTEITMERSQNFDFSSPVLSTRFAILYKKGNESTTEIISPWTIFGPFPIAVWIPFLIISILYFGFLKFHTFRLNTTKFKSMQKLKYSKKFAEIILFVWTVFLITSYISNYTAQKVLQATSVKISRPESLVDLISQKIEIGWLARGPLENFFRNTVNELYQKIYMQNVGKNWLASNKEGVRKVVNEAGNFAFILDSIAADHETQLDSTLYKLPQEFGLIRPIAVATSIGSPLRERINQAVLSLSEQGITESLIDRWFSKRKNSPCSATNEIMWKGAVITNGSLQEMSPIFVLSVFGLFLATIIGLLEMQFFKRKPTGPRPNKPARQQQAELLPKFNLESI